MEPFARRSLRLGSQSRVDTRGSERVAANHVRACFRTRWTTIQRLDLVIPAPEFDPHRLGYGAAAL